MKRQRRQKSKLNLILIFVIILLILVAIALSVQIIQMTDDYIDEEIYYPKDKNEPEKLMYEDYVKAASKEFGIEEAIVYAVIYCESRFDADATSSAGAMGLMQMMPSTFEEMQGYLDEVHETEALYDPKVSIRYGTYYLSRLYRYFGDWETVFAAYNAGPTRVIGWLKDERYAADGKLTDIPYAETSNYVTKVIGMLEIYQKVYPMEEENDT